MLKLKYLFNNEDLAEMIVSNWRHDKDSLGMFQYYRISSNAVYPFRIEEKTALLRFAPKEEKLEDNLRAELEFIAYLRDNGYGALEAVLSDKGEELVEVKTPWGEYYASVFKRVAGEQLSATELSDEVIFSHGQALGELHRLSSQYAPELKGRWSYADVLDWIEHTLKGFPHEGMALAEVSILRDYFDALPVTRDNYGLIHYDFEHDNVFYDQKTASCNVIDFDDAMYHWYAVDIERALDSLKECMPAGQFIGKKQCFLDGYASRFALPSDLDDSIPACRRFADLYSYTRVLRAMEERWEHEPQWMKGLRERLAESMRENSFSFGQELK